MKARLPFVAPHERSCKALVAAGALRSERSLKAAEKASTGCPFRRPAHGRITSKARECTAPSSASRDRSQRQATSRFRCSSRESLVFSRVINPQAQFECQLGSLRLQRWYASPSKYKARLRLHERGLTLPSSGRAYGTPLKSNVRRRKSGNEPTTPNQYMPTHPARDLVPQKEDASRPSSVECVRSLISASSNESFARRVHEFIHKHEHGDSVIEFCTSKASWNACQGSSGFWLQRSGVTVAKLITRMN